MDINSLDNDILASELPDNFELYDLASPYLNDFRESKELRPFQSTFKEHDVEDYSVSVSAIMQRRASTRRSSRKSFKGPRRASSPMGPLIGGLNERRRSSVYTTSSGE